MESSRRPSMTRKYFDAAMLMEFSDQVEGAWIPFCSKITEPSAPLMRELWLFHSTVSNAVFPRGTSRGTVIGSRPALTADFGMTSGGEAWTRRFDAAISIAP